MPGEALEAMWVWGGEGGGGDARSHSSAAAFTAELALYKSPPRAVWSKEDCSSWDPSNEPLAVGQVTQKLKRARDAPLL